MKLTIAAPLRIEARTVGRGAPSATVIRTGMGPARAYAAGRRLVGTNAAVLVAGVAGGLRPDARPGQVVVATEVRTDDGRRSVPLPAAAAVASALRHAGHDVITGPVVCVPRLLSGGAHRSALVAAGAVAVEMESIWLLEPLLSAGMDPRHVAVVRVVADTASHHLVSPRTMTGGTTALRVLRSLGPALQSWAGALRHRYILTASPRSFCAGVERAIAVVERALERYGPPVYVRRQIVHNTHVVRRLEGLGAVFVDELVSVPDGSTVVFAAHGVSPTVRAEAAGRDLAVIDATCPLVAKVHNEARTYSERGYQIVLIGHPDHEEIVGTRGEAEGDIAVVTTPEEVDALVVRDPQRLAYLTQTTLALDETAAVVQRLHARFPTIAGPRADDICYASQNRQEAVRAIAAECDLVIVVGSANSSNSNRLAEVARRAGCPATLVDDASEVDLQLLAGAGTIGITAGASAPESLVEGVRALLGSLGRIDVEERPVVEERVQFRLPVEVR
jgi:4-hydroxy-3-methylbut-2-enyl diphosphate reductase